MSREPGPSDEPEWFVDDAFTPGEVASTGPVLPEFEGTGPVPKIADDGESATTSEASMMSSSVVMAAGTVVSRITGVLRDTMLTAALGLTIVRDAFALGNSLPNVLYILIVGGALNAVFVPQLVRHMKDDADGGRRYGNSLLTATGVVLLALSVISVLVAPWIVSLYATSTYDQSQTALAVAFARYCLPQIFFYGVYTMLAQVLNARGHFAWPMFAPIANNIIAIATYLAFILVVGTATAETGGLTPQQTAWLGIGTTLGVVMQAVVLFPVLVRTGYHFELSWQWRGLGLTKAVRLAMWTIGLVLANQIAFMVITRMATRANVNASQAGEAAAGLATYQTAYLIFILPHSVITVSIVTALLPALSRTVHAGRLSQAGSEVARTARIIVMLVSPIAVALFIVAGPVASVLFGYGAADAAQVSELGTVTRIMALSIMPFTVYYVLLRGWYSMEDTRTPFFLAVMLNAVNVAVAVLLFVNLTPGAQQIYALAWGFDAAYWVMLFVAWPILARRFRGLETGRSVVQFAKVFVASAASLFVALQVRPLSSLTADVSKLEAVWDIILVSAVVLVVYVVMVWLLRIREGSDLWQMVHSRLRRG